LGKNGPAPGQARTTTGPELDQTRT
jgi:hypothetical protein